MRALFYKGPWQMSLGELEAPQTGPAEVKVKVESVGICGSDIHGFTGESGRRPPDMIMGHEASGIITEVGQSVTDLNIGQRVAIYNIISEDPPSSEAGDASFVQKQIIGVNLYRCGAMADYLVIPAACAVPVPDTTSADLAVIAEPLAVILHGWHRLLDHGKKAHRLAILGAGTIGLSAAVLARSMGIEGIVLLDISREKLKRCAHFGFSGILIDKCLDSVQLRKQVIEQMGAPPDVVIEAVGMAASFESASALVANGGTLLLIGNLAKSVQLPLQETVTRELMILGSYAFNQKNFQEAVQLLPSVGEDLERLIEHRCTLEETPDLMTAMAKGESTPLKAIIRVAH